MFKNISFFFLFFLTSLFLYGQDKSYNLIYERAKLETVISDLERHNEVYFSYKSDDVDNIYFTCNKKCIDLTCVLKTFTEVTDLNYELVDGKFVVVTNGKSQQTITGIITVGETGETLPFATVMVLGTGVGTVADEDAKFHLSHDFRSGDSIQINYIGYQSIEVPYQQLLSNNYGAIEMKTPEVYAPFLVIEDYILDGIDLEENGSSTKLSPHLLGSLPGQVEPNVLRSAQFLPGVSAPTSRASDIYIRGGTPDQNLILWEDIPIYHSAHYFGMVSAFNPFAIKQMKVYRGGFGAEYGGRVSGVIDLEAGTGNSSKNINGVGLNLTHGYIYGQQKVGKGSGVDVSYSLRRSYRELWESPTVTQLTRFNQQGFLIGSKELANLPPHIMSDDDFSFFDSHVKLAKQFGKSDRVELSGLYVDNDFLGRITDDARMEFQLDSLQLSNRGLSLSWEHMWSQKVSSVAKLVTTKYEYDYSYDHAKSNEDTSINKGQKQNEISDKQFSYILNYELPQDQSIEGGYHLINYNVAYNVNQFRGENPEINDKNDSSSNLHGMYLSYRKPYNKAVGVNMGLRINYLDINKAFYVEPRLSMTWSATNNLTFTGNVGRHSQFVSQITEFRGSNSGLNIPLWVLSAEDKSVPVQLADVYQVGSIYKKSGWVLDFQAYTKRTMGLTSRAFDLEDLSNNRFEIGSVHARGIDLLIKKSINNIRTWLSYSYSKSELQFPRIQDNSFPVNYDQRHMVNIFSQYKYNDFEFGAGLQIASGLPYSKAIDYDLQIGPNGNRSYTLEYDGINNYNLPMTHELSISAQYKFVPKNDNYNIYFNASITNLLNTENIFFRSSFVDLNAPPLPGPSRPLMIQSSDKSNLRLTPNLSIRIEW